MEGYRPNVPLSQLADRSGEIPSDKRLVLYCASGYRAAIGTSLLRRAGLQQGLRSGCGLAAWVSSRAATVG